MSLQTTPARVAIIIPFFQKERGILARSLASIFAQKGVEDTRIRIVICDDASPVDPEQELADIAVPDRFEVILLRRPNGGPGAARNTALDSLDPAETDFVAFLDSDDEWRENHLSEALAALGADGDFYFCDHTRFDIEGTWFEERGATSGWLAAPDGVFSPTPVPGAYGIDKPVLFAAMAQEYLSQTSTVVYRFATAPNLRFEEALRGAGEDQLFWLSLIEAGTRFVISTNTNAHCGQGVNIYYDAFDWSSGKATDRFGYLVLFRLNLLDRFALPGEVVRPVEEQLGIHQRAYSFLLVRGLMKGRLPNLDIARKIFALSPASIALVPWRFLTTLKNRKQESHSW